ncbi:MULTISPECIES: SMP-30/gluconolactonase/LRE family protein [Pseudomonas]|uniref:L-arabinonolactonase n=2 Tax=Pseudomonas syringae TaxID=317 RepID=A0AB74A210_PSESX|nr:MULTISPECIES: SMP-30/gluconolactonase/LRE family protein [Pseudomonas]ALU59510.1 gluconolaconase [Pseudomonas syringae pv. lapsa]KPX63922.1 L-arabinonolactonase [Pseudomonas syringae pv. lapsa]MDF3132751.1 SMP-30/gluconolactonase/LRE family protein [Pseudomonas extremaustralis]POQ06253.1 SMP-30/gluconolactonase/LRE family protein [Pseudomonas syringae pv. syringae]RML20867.1 L-arabinonolactonase [Pseudomonas syringae pv. lapsa]
MFKALTDTTSLLGECPVWCERTERLFWTDIPGCELCALYPENGEVQRWSLPEPLGSFALTADEDILLMGLASCLGYYNLSSGRFSKVTATPGVAGTRINDGRCDRMGNFVFSTMDTGEPVQTIGRFHRLNAATLETETLDLPEVAIPNSICFSPDGFTMYYADSLQGCIFCCDYPSLENQRVFTTVNGQGAPDGSCIDAHGFLWSAEWGGSRVVRYATDGKVDSVIGSPCIQTTCPVLAGPGYETLYCTSARIGLDKPADFDGTLIEAEAIVAAGLPEERFTGLLN